MANTHLNYLKFEKAISITPSRKSRLIVSRRALQKKIVDYFKTIVGFPVPKFFIQGSFKMKTMVLDKNGTYDVDLGIYFLQKPIVTAVTAKKHLHKAVDNHTTIKTENRDKCIRVVYAGNFDIDLPLYYKTIKDKHPFLATKKGWIESDPKELCDWFGKKKTAQMVRLIKYFKYWANIRRRKMPSGIALTILVANNYISNSRDDLAFYNTAKKIYSSIENSIIVKNPATPNDNLISKLTADQKVNFKNSLETLISYSKKALDQKNNAKAVNILSEQFGLKFL